MSGEIPLKPLETGGATAALRFEPAHVHGALAQLPPCDHLNDDKDPGYFHIENLEGVDSARKMLYIVGDERVFELPAGYSERLHAFLDHALKSLKDPSETDAQRSLFIL